MCLSCFFCIIKFGIVVGLPIKFLFVTLPHMSIYRGLFQCSKPCCTETFENESLIRKMAEQQNDMRIPAEQLPVCPHCGKPLTMNLRADSRFVEDEGWHKAPGIIKYPFWRMTVQNPRATYACVNFGEAYCPKEIEERAICIDGDIGDILCRCDNNGKRQIQRICLSS